MSHALIADIQTRLEALEAEGLGKHEREIVTPQAANIAVATGHGPERVLNLCANNYLGLADHPRLIETAKRAMDEHGFGMASVRFICGTQGIHLALERELAGFLGTEAAILFSSCFDANGGVFEALLGAEDAIISDALNHASIIDGVRLCKARRLRYANNDMAELEARLAEAQDARHRLVVTDGVFSMDGIVANLPGICDLAERYDLDGIHFDYIRFPSADYDYSVGALERFRIWVRTRLSEPRFRELDAAYAADFYALVDGDADLWADFRRAEVTRLVARIYRDVKAHNPRLVVSAAVVADPEVAFNERFQDWRGWLREGILDVAVPMAYTPNSARFEALVRAARSAAGDSRRLWAGIGAYMNSADGTMEMIDIARVEGAGGVVLFSYDWAVGEGRGDPDDPFLMRIGRGRFGR
ncbi:MAG: aminotransferase class I/II-fold pyridoxal phosphate-dependent enzyme [Gemmatimonadetes bacterium]|nr:aminotransferase class I/II-fold pyridoxal phosphate-dependent enzyme [Gemmatimonadota bacterium]